MPVNLSDVSRETLGTLKAFQHQFRKWNARINLAAVQSDDDLWVRHIVDSVSLVPLLPESAGRYADLGTGGGFPGVIVAICRPDLTITLVESDQRKAAFLRSIRRDLQLSFEVAQTRIEECPPLEAKILSARALAPLSQLLAYAERHLTAGGRAFFLKGEAWQSEVDAAKKLWNFGYSVHGSAPASPGVILEVFEVKGRSHAS